MNWPTAPLGELCEMDRQGIRPDDPDASLLPFLGVENVEAGSGAINLNTGKRVGNQKSTSFRFDQRHVLYGKLRPYLNKIATPEFAGKCSTELVPLRPQVGVDRQFLGYLLRRQETVDHVMSSVTGARMPRTNMKALLLLPVPIPPLDEQRRIVDILNRAAKIGRLRRRAQERLQEFIPALFVKMFGDPVENPMGWEIAPLRKFCVLTQYGTSKKANEHAGGVPILRMGNVTYEGDLDCTDLKFVSLSDAEFEKYSLSPGDILFNRTNSKELVGKTGVWDGRFPAVAASYFIRLRFDKTRALSTYVWALMNSSAMKRRLYFLARGAIGQANINTKEVHSLVVAMPPVSHQHRFAGIIEKARAAIIEKTAGSTTCEALSVSLMSRLLGTGA